MRRWVVTIAVVGITALLAAGCSTGPGAETADGRARVVAAFSPVAEAARRVGADCVAVRNLTPAGAEPHDLELTPDEVDAIQDARVVFVMGHGFQPAIERAAEDRDGPTVKLLDHVGIDARGRAVGAGGGRDVLDPHVWLDPVRYSRLVDAVAAALERARPSCRAKMQRNAAALQAEIAAVDHDYSKGLHDCRRRTIVTAHAAFGWLARRYHLDQQGIAGIAPDEEPNAARLADLADLVHRDGITTIFTETLVSKRVADALAREAGGVRTATLNPLEGLTDAERARGDDWASVMRANLAKLRAALGCR